MKNSVKQKDDQTGGKRSWKHKVNPCNDLDGASRWNKVETWNTGRKDKHYELRCDMMDHSGKKEVE